MPAEIPLSRGKVALIDEADLPLVGGRKWSAKPVRLTFYAYRAGNAAKGEPGTVYMHRLLVGAGPGQKVDHRDRNGLNNQRHNLRPATQGQNGANVPARKDFKGVARCGSGFRARVTSAGNTMHIGVYATAEEAARAYDREAFRHFGEFAHLNFPGEPVAAPAVERDWLDVTKGSPDVLAAYAEFCAAHPYPHAAPSP